MVNRKGQTMRYVIAIVGLILAVLVGFFFYYRANLTNLTNQQLCHQSVVFAATGKGITQLDCKTDYVCISGGKECSNMTPTITVNVDPTSKDQIMKAIADQLASCWYTYGEGKLDYLGISKGFKGGSECGVCSIIGFDKSVQDAMSTISPPASASQYISGAEGTKNYNLISDNGAYSSLFDEYSKDYQPTDLSQNYFKKLLISIAYQSNWGTPSGSGNWVLGYHVNDENYKTPEEQISTVSKILQGAFDGGANGGYQTGSVTGNYADCNSASNLDEKTTCILSVYHTGELPSQWKADHTPIVGHVVSWGEKLLGIKKNVAGDNYAAEVLFNWKAIREYGQISSVNTNSNTPSYPLTYKDLIDYLAANKVTEDNQVQTYMSFLYGVSSVAQLLTVSEDKKAVTDLYDSGHISLDGQYAIVTGEGKSALWGVTGSMYLRPVFLNTNDLSTYLGGYCSSYLTYS